MSTRPHDPTLPTTTTRTVRGRRGIAATLQGHGPNHVLVLHDWNGDHHGYDPILPYLDRAQFTYAFADLRGYGLARDVPGLFTVDEISADCLDLADALGWQQFHVVGHSMTGMAAQRIAADAPARVRSGVLVCPMTAAGSPIDDATRAFFASTTHDDDAFLRLMRFVSGGAEHGLGEGWLRERLRHCRASVNPACRDGYLQMFTRTQFVDAVRGSRTRFGAIVGDMDPGIDAAAMRATVLAWYTHARLIVMPHCGHYPMQACPPAFARTLEGLLST